MCVGGGIRNDCRVFDYYNSLHDKIYVLCIILGFRDFNLIKPREPLVGNRV